MAFPWPGKKDTREPGAKPEFPAGFEDFHLMSNEAESKGDAGKAEGEPPARPAADQGALATLTARLEHLGLLLDQTKEQVTSYLVARESQAASDAGKAMAGKLDSLVEKLEGLSGGGSRTLDQKLDALYGKLDQLANAPRAAAVPAGEGAGGAATEAALKGSLRPLIEKLEQVDAKCKSLADRTAAIDALKEAFVPNLVKVRDGLSEQHAALGGAMRQIQEILPQYFNALPQYFTAIQQQVVALQQRVDASARTLLEKLLPPEPEPDASPSISGDWQAAVFGPVLAANPALAQQRQQLLSGVLAGEPTACSLSGNLLLFRAAPAEKMPTLLKEVGEAYYRWQPRATNKPSEMEKALVDWLQHACDDAGVPNTIELVHPGERFDSTRHSASERGVEITEVLGWIVLRDNGRVYTKAAVAVK